MKAINQKLLKQQYPLHQLAEERKLNNIHIRIIKKVGVFACLFFCVSQPVFAQTQWRFSETSKKAYDLVLNLQLEEAEALIPNPKTADEHYVLSFGEMLYLLLTEDNEKYVDYKKNFETRINRKTKASDPNDYYTQACIRLQWAFVQLKFGNEIDAGLQLRQATNITEDLVRKFPQYSAGAKLDGILNIVFGAVPEKYNWILTVLNIEGSVKKGLALLQQLTSTDPDFALEADLLRAVTFSSILQQTNTSFYTMKEILSKHPKNRLALFIGATVALKDNNSEQALTWISSLENQTVGFPIAYEYYHKGEALLHKGAYLEAISAYRSFLKTYQGQNFVKDANFKIATAYWLHGNSIDAKNYAELAKRAGKDITEADKHATRSLEAGFPHIKLAQARYATDGGYYEKAEKILDQIRSEDLPTMAYQIEFAYRKARLAHKTNQFEQAKILYQLTIDMNGTENFYYAPNACLQIGYLYAAENNNDLAIEYCKRALSYKKHEYKNSIDSKARSLIAQLSKAK
jgi:tetratricopeptide (TPR) repeat protein